MLNKYKNWKIVHDELQDVEYNYNFVQQLFRIFCTRDLFFNLYRSATSRSLLLARIYQIFILFLSRSVVSAACFYFLLKFLSAHEGIRIPGSTEEGEKLQLCPPVFISRFRFVLDFDFFEIGDLNLLILLFSCGGSGSLHLEDFSDDMMKMASESYLFRFPPFVDVDAGGPLLEATSSKPFLSRGAPFFVQLCCPPPPLAAPLFSARPPLLLILEQTTSKITNSPESEFSKWISVVFFFLFLSQNFLLFSYTFSNY